MERKTWTVDVDGQQHVVALEWTYFGGRRRVSVDQHVVEDSHVPMRWKSTQEFAVGGKPAVLTTKPKSVVMFVISLEVDGKEIRGDGQTTAFWEHPNGEPSETETARSA